MLHCSFSVMSQVEKGRILKVFTIYGHDGHLGHRAKTTDARCCFPDSWKFEMTFYFNWLSLAEASESDASG